MLTHRGFAILSTLPAYIFASWISNQPTFIVTGMLIMFIIIVDAFIFKLNLEKLAWINVERIINQNYVETGDEVLIRLKITNALNSHIGPITVDEVISDTLKIVRWTTNNVVIIPPKDGVQLEYVIKVLGVGRHKIYGTKITYFDALNLFVSNIVISNESYITAGPQLSLIMLSVEPYINKYFYEGFSRSISGSSKEFAEIRQYLPGDDYKSLAWKIISKHPDFLVVKEYMREEHINVKIILDASEQMLGGYEGKRKIDIAIYSIISLCYMASKLKDDIDLLVYPQFIRRIFSHRDRNQFQNVINFLSTILPEGSRDLIKLNNYLKDIIRRGELIFLITDTDIIATHLIELVNNIRALKGIPIIALLDTSKFSYPSNIDTTKIIAYDILIMNYNTSLSSLIKSLKSSNVTYNLCDINNCTTWLLSQYIKFRTLKGVAL